MNIDNPFIADRIANTMEQLANLPSPLPAMLMDAGQLIAKQLISGKKLFVLGLDDLAPFAQLLCQNLLYDNHEDRPALPAICLNDLVSQAPLSGPHAQQLAVQRSVQALTQSGDLLLILCSSSENSTLEAILDHSAARNVANIVACQSNGNSEMLDPSASTDLTNGPSGKPLYLVYGNANDNFTRTHEVILFILRCLSDIIDQQLFGDHNVAE